MTSPFPCCPVNREGHVKENPDRKQKEKTKGCDLRVIIFLWCIYGLDIFTKSNNFCQGDRVPFDEHQD